MNINKIRKILIGILIVLVITLIGFIIYLLVTKEEYIDTKLVFITRDIEVYEEVSLKDLIDEEEQQIVLLEDIDIDTTKIKEETIDVFYKKEKKKYKAKANIKVVDTTIPKIFASSSYTFTEGSTTNLVTYILSGDNYDNNPKREILGDYDMNTPGTYNLTYKITDQSNNTQTQNFTLKVKKKVTYSGGSSSSSKLTGTNFSYYLENYKNDNTEICIDVSKWQGNIDFKKVKDAGCSFVIIRVGHQSGINGDLILDPYFEKNIENATKNDLKVGVYLYTYAKEEKEARKQVEWVYSHTKKYKLDFGISYDWESWTVFNNTSQSFYKFNKVAETFLKETKKYKQEGMLYGSKYYLNNIFDYNKKNVWLAHYTKQTDYDKLYRMWQISSTGLIDGINANVDINIWNKNI